MVKASKRQNSSVIFDKLSEGYFIIQTTIDINSADDFLSCKDCEMSRISMCCYAATKRNTKGSDDTVARMQPEKMKTNSTQYNEMETSISLDKYNGKLMNSIWGLYNRNSPHNFKKQNANDSIFNAKGQAMDSTKFLSSPVQFSIPQFNLSGIVQVETKFEVKKPKTTLEKVESLMSFPIY